MDPYIRCPNMADTRWNRVKDALLAILDQPANQREAAIAALDIEIRDEVRALVDAEGSDGEMLDRSPALFDVAEVARAIPDSSDLVGAVVGPYRIIKQIGRGGMGEVYLAERADGLTQRRVAVKVVRSGADTEAVLARFDAERRILGRLQHRGIARLLDAGRVEDVRPWIAMDYVDGQPITEYALSNNLSTDDRVGLLADTARIVHEAHRNLVVHRDLKPSNVLVRKGPEGVAEPVLLDFGIAKLLDTDPDDDALTETGMGPMTRAYAAPEQLRREEATTATDVYALGLLLYEMLAGARPFADAGTPAEQEIAVLKTDPPPPSRLADATTSGTGKRLRGDLDTICLTALEKDPTKRYASADALAADLQRHLDGLPITARPPTVGYRVRKFVRRHRLGVAAAAAFVALLIAAVGVTTYQSVQLAEAARIAAEQRDRAEAVSDFLSGLFESADPTAGGDPDESVRSALDRGAAGLDEDLEEQPSLRADLLRVVGKVYTSLGAFDQAEKRLDQAIALARGTGDNAVLADALLHRGNLHYRMLDYDGADAPLAESLALSEAENGRLSSEVATVLNSIALVAEKRGDTTAAIAALSRVVDIRRAEQAGRPDRNLAANLSNLAEFVTNTGDLPRAEALYSEALENLKGDVGAEHPYVAFLLNSRAGLYLKSGDAAKEKADLTEALRIAEAAFGPEHPFHVVALHNLGVNARTADRRAEARAYFIRALAIAEKVLPPDHPDIQDEREALRSVE